MWNKDKNIHSPFFSCQILGAIKDSTGTFELAYLMMGCMITLGGILYAIEPVARRLENRRLGTHKNTHIMNGAIYQPCTTSEEHYCK